MKNKLISFAAALIILAGTFNIGAYASPEEDFSEQISLLIKLGAFPADEGTASDTKIKRDCFAKYFASFVNQSTDISQKPEKSYYYDVSLGNEYLSYINILTETGFLRGYDDGKYKPENYITNREMLKCVIAALGYTPEVFAEDEQNSYLSVASELRLTECAGPLDEAATVGTAVNLFYNALEKNVLETSFSQAGQYEINNDLDYLEKRFKIKKKTGIIDGNYLTQLNGNKSDMGEDYISVSGERFLITEENKYISDYIGYKVDIYYKKSGSDNEIAAFVNDKTEELVISAENIDSFTDNKINYTLKDSDKIKKVSLTKTPAVIYNGAAVTSYSEDIIENINDGSVELLRYSGDSAYSVVKIYNYKTYAIKSVSDNKLIMKPQKRLNPDYDKDDPVKNTLDEYLYDYTTIALDDYSHVFIRNVTGAEVKLSEIRENNIVSIGVSADSGIIYINAETGAVSGEINSIYTNSSGDKCIRINDNEYCLGNDFEKNTDILPALKMNVTAYFDYRGKIAYMEADKLTAGEWQYGYLMNLFEDEATEDCTIKIFTTEGKVERFLLRDKVKTDGITIKKADAVKLFRVVAGNSEHDEFGVEPQLIRYKIRGDRVSDIDTAQVNISGNEKSDETLSLDGKYADYQFFWNPRQFVCLEGSSFDYDNFDTSLRVDDNTLIFSVPDPLDTNIGYSGARSNEKLYSVQSGTGMFAEHQTYTFGAYDIDYDNGAIAKVLVTKEGESEKWEENIVIKEINKTVDEDDLPCTKIVGYNLGNANTTDYKISSSLTTFEDVSNPSDAGVHIQFNIENISMEDSQYPLKPGDVIRIKTSGGSVSKIRRYYSTSFLDRKINAGTKDMIRLHGVIQSDGTFMGTRGAATDTVMLGVITDYNNGYISFYNIDPSVSMGLKASAERSVPKHGKVIVNIGNKAVLKYNSAKNRLEVIDKENINEYLYSSNMKAYTYLFTEALQLNTIVIYE